MKSLLIPVAAVLAAIVLVPSLNAQDVRKTYQDGIQAYNAQDYKVALEKFLVVRKSYPNDPKLGHYIAQTRMFLKQANEKVGTLEHQLSNLMIQDIEFENASINTIIDFLRAKALELTERKLNLNILYKGTDEERNAGVITLKLTNVPMTEVIRYVGEMSRTSFQYDGNAVVGTPKRMMVEQPTAPTQPASNDPFGKPPFA